MCFWFVPPSLRGKQESPYYSERLAEVGCLRLWLTQFQELTQLVRFCPLLAMSGTGGPFAPQVEW